MLSEHTLMVLLFDAAIDCCGDKEPSIRHHGAHIMEEIAKAIKQKKIVLSSVRLMFCHLCVSICLSCISLMSLSY